MNADRDDEIVKAASALLTNGQGRTFKYLVLRDTPAGRYADEGGSYSEAGIVSTLRAALALPAPVEPPPPWPKGSIDEDGCCAGCGRSVDASSCCPDYAHPAPVAPRQEAVAWAVVELHPGSTRLWKRCIATFHIQSIADAVKARQADFAQNADIVVVPLYAHPPASPRDEATVEEVAAIIRREVVPGVGGLVGVGDAARSVLARLAPRDESAAVAALARIVEAGVLLHQRRCNVGGCPNCLACAANSALNAILAAEAGAKGDDASGAK